jgi:hypothetical protein
VSASGSHGEQLAASGDDASRHGEPLFEGGGEGLLEGLGIGTGQAKGSGDGVHGRGNVVLSGSGIIGRHKGEELRHETKSVVGAGERAGEEMFKGVRQ